MKENMGTLPQMIFLILLAVVFFSSSNLVTLLLTVEGLLIISLFLITLVSVAKSNMSLYFISTLSFGVSASILGLSVVLKLTSSTGSDLLFLNPKLV